MTATTPPALLGRWTFDAIGTRWEIETPEVLPVATVHAVMARIEEYDRAWSRFREDSLVARITREPGRHVLPAEAGELFDLYRRLYTATDGRVSPLVGASLDALGYDREYSLRGGTARPTPAWDDAVAWDGEALTTLRPATLDVGAAGKGQLVDLVGEVLRAHGEERWIVDAGGDIRRAGTGSIRVALEHPLNPQRAIGLVPLAEGAICASAVNRRTWGDGLHHVLDATTGLPTRSVLATWALAPDAMTADGAATALFFGDPLAIGEEFAVQWVRMLSSGVIETSPDFPGDVFP